MPLTRRTVSAVRITVLASVAGMLLQGVILVILARLLTAQDYGLYALAVAAAQLTSGLTVGSIERSFIVRPPDESAMAQGLRHVLLAMGGSAVGLLAYWLIGAFAGFAHHGPLALTVLMASYPAAFVVGIRADLRRRLRFAPIVLADFAGQFVGVGVIAVSCAAAGWGAYALAAGALGQSLTAASVLMLATRRFPGDWDVRGFGAYARRIWPVMQTAFSESANGQIPSLLIPSLLGIARLGLFNRTYALIQLPVEIAVTAVTRVLVSGLVAAREERERLLRAVRRTVMLTTALSCPVAGGVIACRHDLITVVLGPQWLEGAQLVPFLAVATFAIMTGSIFATHNEAVGLFREKTVIQVTSSAALVVGLAVGASLAGLAGATAAMAVANLLWLALSMRCAGRRLGVTVWHMAAWLRPGIIAAFIVAAAGAGASLIADRWLPPVAGLAFDISACGLAAALYYALFQRALFLEAASHFGLARFLPMALRDQRGLSDA